MTTPTLRSARVRWTLYAVAGAAVGLAIWLSDAPGGDPAVVGAVDRSKAPAMRVPTDRAGAAANGAGWQGVDASEGAAARAGTGTSAASPTTNATTQSRSTASGRGADGSPVVATLPVSRAPTNDPAADPFGPPDWLEAAELGAPPVPVRARPLPPPRPSVPPMPFVYLGKWSEGTQTTVFLAHGGHELALKVGSEIDRTWRVASIADDRMVLTYLPLKAARTLVFADAVAATTTTAAAPAFPDGNEPESN